MGWVSYFYLLSCLISVYFCPGQRVCVLFTFNRSFYPSTFCTTSARAALSILEAEIQVMLSQSYATEILRCHVCRRLLLSVVTDLATSGGLPSLSRNKAFNTNTDWRYPDVITRSTSHISSGSSLMNKNKNSSPVCGMEKMLEVHLQKLGVVIRSPFYGGF